MADTMRIWERRLAEAARDWSARLLGTGDGGAELQSTLSRLGFAAETARQARSEPHRLTPDTHRALREALRAELSALARRARSGRADYDLNRHIAVARAVRRIGGYDAAGSASRRVRAPRSSATAASVAVSIRP